MTPNWVIKNIQKHGNCALPNSYTKMDRKILAEKLTEDVGKPIVIRETSIEKFNGEKEVYLIAEVK